MRLFTCLIPGLFVGLVPLIVAKSSGSTTDSYTTAFQSSFPIRLTDKTFSSLTSTPRDFGVVVLLTAVGPKYGCVACRDLQPEWEVLAKSWQRGDRKGESRVVFAQIDFAQGRATFQALGLQHAPLVFLYPPTTGMNAKISAEPIRYDFSRNIADAATLRNWIATNLPDGPKPAIVHPINYTRLVLLTTTILGVVSLLSVTAPYILPIMQNRNTWAALSLLTILLFTSGHMYNHIRKVPYVASDNHGGMVYFAAGFQSQYGMETQIIAAIYGFLSFAVINIAIKCPRIADPKGQQVAVVVWTAAMFGIYSFLLNIFRWKNAGYPFFLPPF